MQSAIQLQELLRSINRKSYPAYKSLKGVYQFQKYILAIDHVQGDPFASPSHVSVKISHKAAGFPAAYYKDHLTRITLADYLTRQFEQQVNRYTFRAKGSGKSGLISVTKCGQEVLERTACEITEQGIIARFFVGFPANGRTINSGELEKIFFEFLPVCVEKAFFYRNLSGKDLENAIFLAEDQQFIREEISRRSLAAFVNDGAVLPRESGISSRPMKNCVDFSSPESLRVTMELPHKGRITGMGIPKGITLIVGGGYHGKSTLLNALELGVYNHIQGDGREYVITDSTAQKLRSEDGRFIKDVDISLFINNIGGTHHAHTDLSVKLLFLPDVICLDCLQLRVGQQDEGQIVFLRKFLMGSCTILADADHHNVLLFKLFIGRGKSTGLTGAARSIVLGIKIQNNLFPEEIRQAYLPAILV